MNLASIQHFLTEHEIDCWLLADFHGRNDIAMKLLDIDGMLTRRSFYIIPAEGEPIMLANAVEKDLFRDVPGTLVIYSGYRNLEKELRARLAPFNRVAMEYSPHGRLPYIGLVDAGTIELVRSFGVELVSSADLVANFQARLSPEQIAFHRMAAGNVIEVKERTFRFIRESLAAGRIFTEFDVVRFMLAQFEDLDMETDKPPMCCVDGNAGNPHYGPTAERSAEIKKGQLILLDLWAKVKHRHGIYADITWMAFTGKESGIPERYAELFDIVVRARDAAVDFVRKHIDSRPVYGYEVDDATRKVIVDAGYGERFVHRTGHSIADQVHGPGPNIDNLETEDSRRLQPGHLFSVEPGVYFDDCGFRSEIDVLIDHNGADITTMPKQQKIVALLD